MTAATALGHRALFTADHDAFRDSVHRFMAARVVAQLPTWRSCGSIPIEVLTAAGEAGFLSVNVPEEYGGAGLEDLGFLAVLLDEAMEAGATGLGLLWALHSGVVTPAIAASGTPAARGRWLPALADGRAVAAVAPTADLNVTDGRVSGRLPNVPFGRGAELLVITLPGGEAALVATGQQGVSMDPVDANLAAPESGLADITLDGVAIGADDVLGDADLSIRLQLWFAVLALAGAGAALRLAEHYTRERHVFGRPLAEFDNTRLRLADLTAGLAATTTFVDACLSAPTDLDAVRCAVAHQTAAALHDGCVDQALQLHGGYGYMREYPVSQAFADARFLRLLASQCVGPPHRALADALPR